MESFIDQNLWFLELGWVAVLAAIFTLLNKPRGLRLYLLVIGLLGYLSLELSLSFMTDNAFLINLSIVVAMLAFLMSGILTLFYLKEGKSKQSSSNDNSIKEALSVIPIIDDNPADQLNVARQSLYNIVEASIEKHELSEGTNIQLLQSQDYANVCFVSLSMFQPANSDKKLTKKLGTQSVLLIRLEAHPFKRFPITYSIRVESSNKQKEFSDVYEMDANKLDALITQMIKGEKWKYKPKRLRQAPIQFWRPSNKIVDYKITNVMYVFVALFPPIIIFPLIGWLIFGKKPRLKLTTGKPSTEPRNLLQLDSWQVAIKGLQNYAQQLESEFISEMQKTSNEFGKLNEENIWYWGVDGKVERKQQVFRIGRAMVFIKIYGYGDDLYIGWDAHVNAGSWGEQNIGSGFAFGSGLPVDAYEIVAQWHQPNEYDISDANFALETVHATLVKLTKRLVKERDIDQEIDFTIVRESRSGVLKKENNREDGKKKRFMRTG